MPKPEAADAPLCHYLDELIDDLRRMMPDALERFDEQAIHKSRVATRRLKAALDLLAPVLDADDAKPLAKLGKKLRRRLGPLRDADVMLSHLEEIKPGSKHADAASWMRQQLEQQREAAREASRKAAPANRMVSKLGAWWAIREDVAAADEALPSLLAESLHLQVDRFIESARQQGGDPHQIRIAGKLLRYTLELAEAQGMAPPKVVLKSFKSMQEHLGTWHDFVVMAEQAMRISLETELPLHDPGMQRAVLDLASFAMGRAERELQRFKTLWNERGERLAETIREAFPLTRSLIESKTDPDPAGSPTPPSPPAAPTDPPPAA